MGELIHTNFLINVNPSNYLKIKNNIPSNVKILAVSKGFKSQEIKTIQNLGQNDFGENKKNSSKFSIHSFSRFI